MKLTHLAAIAAIGSCLAACGGNGDDNSPDSGPTTPPAGATLYPEVTPPAGSTETFVTAKIDDANNTINGTYTETVASANSDGTYTIDEFDPTGSTLNVDGITYHLNPSTLSFGSDGVETGVVVSLPNGSTQTCTLSTLTGGHAHPIWVGQAWAQTRRESCTPGTVETLTESGSVLALESVTVPAGTFMALKETNIQSWTDANGQNITETITHWADPAHYMFTIKSLVTWARSGKVPTHFVTSETIELQSRSTP